MRRKDKEVQDLYPEGNYDQSEPGNGRASKKNKKQRGEPQKEAGQKPALFAQPLPQAPVDTPNPASPSPPETADIALPKTKQVNAATNTAAPKRAPQKVAQPTVATQSANTTPPPAQPTAQKKAARPAQTAPAPQPIPATPQPADPTAPAPTALPIAPPSVIKTAAASILTPRAPEPIPGVRESAQPQPAPRGLFASVIKTAAATPPPAKKKDKQQASPQPQQQAAPVLAAQPNAEPLPTAAVFAAPAKQDAPQIQPKAPPAAMAAPIAPQDEKAQPLAENATAALAAKAMPEQAAPEAKGEEQVQALEPATKTDEPATAQNPQPVEAPPARESWKTEAAPDPVAAAVPGEDASFLRRALFAVKTVLPRVAATLIFAALLIVPLYLFYNANVKVGYIYEQQSEQQQLVATVLVSEKDYFETVVERLDLRDEDLVEYVEQGVSADIIVRRAAAVTIAADGREQTLYTQPATVAELLEQAGIELGEDDFVEPGLDETVGDDCTLAVHRVTYEYETVTEVVAAETVRKPSPLISEGAEVFCVDGKDGLAERTYRTAYIDGEAQLPEVVEETIIDYKRDNVTLIGDKSVCASHLDGADFTDVEIVDGVPASYEFVLEDAVCTAYSFNPGTYGASGMLMIQGFVAVNPNVIPYGSLLYITSKTEGGFVYGWAIAADVGEAMMDGYVDIDCFFETYRESALFGKKWLNVYVVDQLTQDELEDYIRHSGMFYSRIPETPAQDTIEQGE